MAAAEDTSLPDYPQMIMTAIEALDEKEGSNKSAISNYIDSNYPDLPANHSTLLTQSLDKMKESGQLVFAKNNYLKPDPNAPPKRGRGRPPKPKTDPPQVTGPPRPRGRPPKPKDPLAPLPSPKKKSLPSGSPRGRPPKKAKTAAPVVATGGVKRGRGRPPKVRPSAAPPAATVGA